MKRNWKVEALTGIGYVYHHLIYAETAEEAMEHLRNVEKECDYYWDHCNGLIAVTNAWPSDR